MVSCSDITSSVDADRHSLTVTSAGSSKTRRVSLALTVRSMRSSRTRCSRRVDTERAGSGERFDESTPVVVGSRFAEDRQVSERHGSDGIDALE